jgi:hypothetical protein
MDVEEMEEIVVPVLGIGGLVMYSIIGPIPKSHIWRLLDKQNGWLCMGSPIIGYVDGLAENGQEEVKHEIRPWQ